MSGAGFRTLAVAARRLGRAEYEQWAAAYKDAAASLDAREAKVCVRLCLGEGAMCVFVCGGGGEC